MPTKMSFLANFQFESVTLELHSLLVKLVVTMLARFDMWHTTPVNRREELTTKQ